MDKILNLLSQRRIWAGIGAIISFSIALSGVKIGFDSVSFVNAVMSLIGDVAAVAATVLPIWSYFQPKNPVVVSGTPVAAPTNIQ
jgi:hypothetical protein